MRGIRPARPAYEEDIYPAAAALERLRLLVDAMVTEHRVLEGLVDELRAAKEPVRAAALGHALRVLFDTHLAKENDLLLPAVAADPGDLPRGRPRRDARAARRGRRAPPRRGRDPVGTAKGSCGCGGHDDDEIPVLDVRAVPHASRRATVFGAFDAVPEGGALLLVAPHDPLPLLRQLW